jgi:hypothetical protein
MSKQHNHKKQPKHPKKHVSKNVMAKVEKKIEKVLHVAKAGRTHIHNPRKQKHPHKALGHTSTFKNAEPTTRYRAYHTKSNPGVPFLFGPTLSPNNLVTSNPANEISLTSLIYKGTLNPGGLRGGTNYSEFALLPYNAILFREWFVHKLKLHYVSTSGSAFSSTNAATGEIHVGIDYNVNCESPSKIADLQLWENYGLFNPSKDFTIDLCEKRRKPNETPTGGWLYVRDANGNTLGGAPAMGYDFCFMAITVNNCQSLGNILGRFYMEYDIEFRDYHVPATLSLIAPPYGNTVHIDGNLTYSTTGTTTWFSSYAFTAGSNLSMLAQIAVNTIAAPLIVFAAGFPLGVYKVDVYMFPQNFNPIYVPAGEVAFFGSSGITLNAPFSSPPQQQASSYAGALAAPITYPRCISGSCIMQLTDNSVIQTLAINAFLVSLVTVGTAGGQYDLFISQVQPNLTYTPQKTEIQLLEEKFEKRFSELKIELEDSDFKDTPLSSLLTMSKAAPPSLSDSTNSLLSSLPIPDSVITHYVPNYIPRSTPPSPLKK